MSDLWLMIYWFVMLTVIGAAGFPLLWFLLRRLPDGGFGVSIPFSLVLSGWLVWLWASLKLIPFSVVSGALALGSVAIASSIIVWKHRDEFRSWITTARRIVLFEMLLACIAFLFWSFIRGFQPDIQGLEKFMDAGFVQSILRSKWMPPPDPWLAGDTINYYYFGHFLSALLTLLSGVDLSVAYNLLLATVFSLVITGSFSVIYNVVGGGTWAAVSGVLGAILLNLGGNLHPLWFTIFRSGASYWYPDATRFIPYTIHEFPAYSHVVADLHGHLLNLPIVLLFLVSLVAFLKHQNQRKKENLSQWVGSGLTFPIMFGFLLGVFSMTNTWDVPIYGMVYGFVVLVYWWIRRENRKHWLIDAGLTLAISALTFLFTSLLFQIHFTNIAKGVALVESRSPLWQLGVLWGGFLTIAAVAFWWFFPTVGRDSVAFLPIVMIGVSVLLLIIPEIIYIKDIYIQEYHRANTMFKLTYQSFVMFSLVFGMTLGHLLRPLRNARGVVSRFKSTVFREHNVWAPRFGALVLLSVFALHMLYTKNAIKGYYGDLKTSRGLNGLQWFQTSYPDDYSAFLWMKKNVVGQPVILEAVGESYTDFARISTFTGFPTVLGWRVHEWLWRGSFDEAGKRTEEVRVMYEDPESREAQTLFSTYNIVYLFVGQLERQTYKIDEDTLTSLGRIVFRAGDTIVIKRNG